MVKWLVLYLDYQDHLVNIFFKIMTKQLAVTVQETEEDSGMMNPQYLFHP